ncbi:MAG: hypothetical protein ABI895_00310 [Deltaproteobacteria bacterium]
MILNLRAAVERRLVDDGATAEMRRQLGICRNLTDQALLGGLLGQTKTLIWAGSYHSAVHHDYPSEESFLREAVYLQHEFPPTRGQVYALRVLGLAYQFEPEDAELPPAASSRAGRGYATLVAKLQAARDAGQVEWGVPYTSAWTNMSVAERLLVKAPDFRATPRPQRLTAFPWRELGAVLTKALDTQGLQRAREDIVDHDANLYIGASRPVHAMWAATEAPPAPTGRLTPNRGRR